MNKVRIPKCSGSRPLTNKNMLHSQIGMQPLPDVHNGLFRRAFALPNVTNRSTVILVPGASTLARSELATNFVAGRCVNAQEITATAPSDQSLDSYSKQYYCKQSANAAG